MTACGGQRAASCPQLLVERAAEADAPARRRSAGPAIGTRLGLALAGHTGKILAACVDSDRTRARERVDRLLLRRIPDDLVRAAQWHRVCGFLLETLPSRADLDSLQNALRTQHEDATLRHLRALADLRRLADLLNRAGLDWLVFKGPVLAERYYGPDAARAYDDIDVLVQRADFATTLSLLLASGCEEVQQNWSFMTAEQAAEVQLRGWHGTPLDIHWAPLFTADLRRRFALDMPAALARARTVQIARTAIPTLDRVDTLLHLCLHAAMEGGNRLVWMKDVERCISVEQPPWDVVVKRATEWRIAAVTGIMLARVNHTLSARVPDEVTRQLLGGRTAAAITVAVDAGWPVARSSDRGSPSRMLSRAAGATWSDTAHRVLDKAARLRARNVAELVLPRLKKTRTGRLYGKSEGDATREEFLASLTPDLQGRPDRPELVRRSEVLGNRGRDGRG